MKFSTTALVLAAASLSTVLAAPAPATDGGDGIPPAATISASEADAAAVSTTTVVDTTTTVTSSTTSASHSATNVHTTSTKANAHGTTSASSSSSAAAASTSSTARPDINIPYGPSNALVKLSPATAADWKWQAPVGVFNVTAAFSVAQQESAQASFLPPQTFRGLQIWAWQQTDGGMMELEIDGAVVAKLDYYNKTAGAHDAPVKLYDNQHLERAHHSVVLKNIVDTRVHKAGTFNLDHFVITTEEDAATTSSSSTATASSTKASSSTVSTSVVESTGDSGLATTSSASKSSQSPAPNAGARVRPTLAAGVLALALGVFALF